MKQPAIYIMASQRNGTLYIGVTSDLVKRVWEYREGVTDGFTKDYNCKTLVWYEQADTMEAAIHREKRLKKYTRGAKLKLIESINPAWKDLWTEVTGSP